MDRSLCNAVVLLWALFGSIHSCKNGASTPLVTFGELSEVIIDGYTLRSVEAIEEDLLNPGGFIVCNKHSVAVIAPNRTVQILAGEESATSLSIDSFSTAQHLTQYRDGADVIVADYNNHCIKIINRETRMVRIFAGRCTLAHVEQRAPALEAKLPHPVGVLYVKEKNLFYYLLEEPIATIVEHDLDTGYVSVKFQDQERFRYPSSMVIDSKNMYLYVTHYLGGISRFDTETWEREIVAGIVTPKDDVVPPSRDGKLLESRFYYGQTGMAWLIQDQVLIVGQREDRSLRVVNFVDDKVYTICKVVESVRQPNFSLGEPEICKMNNPRGLVVVNGSVYIGEFSGRRQSAKRGHILKLPYAQPFCEVSPHPDVTALSLQEVYTHNQVVEYECDRKLRLAISANYTTTRCIRCCENETLIGRWDRDPPTQCQTPILIAIEPQQGQRAGGTMVTLTGTFPPNVHVSLKDMSQNVWTSAPLPLKTNKQLAFSMPPRKQNSSSDVKILVAFEGDDTKIGIRNYTYLPNPVIRYVSRNESIASGGLTIKFYGDEIASGHKYEFVVYQETLNATLATTDCQKEETFVSCLTPNLTEVFETRVRRSADDDVENITLYMSLLSDNWPVPGTNLTYDVVNSYPKIDLFTDSIPFDLEKDSQLMFNGTNLDTSVTLEDYTVTLVLEQQATLTCKVTALNQTRMFCKPPAQKILSIIRPNEDVIEAEVKVEVGSLSETVGRVEFIDSVEPISARPDKSDSVTIIAASVSAVFVVGVLSVVAAVLLMRRCCSTEDKGKPEPEPKPNPGLGVSEDILSKLRGMYIDPLDLGFDLKTNPIGKGNFGKVYLGQLRLKQSVLKTVAVKTLKETEDVNVDQLEEFLQEATFLKHLKHPNILSTIGIVWRDGDRPQVVLPYMALGDLCSLIQKPTMVFTNGDLLHFGMQVASGMEYLIKSRCLHRDLAARNCLVDEEFFVKIADFGMSKDVYADNYYRESDKSKPKPMRWMALESLRDGVYNAQTEVWSFGVLMWELFTRGSLPYPGVNNSEVIHHIVMGYRLYRPSYVHPEIFQRVEKCWSENPADRPTFTELKDFFEFCLVQGRQQQDNQKPYYEEEEEFCYSYVQNLTMHIPNDYTSSTAYDDIYMGVTYIVDPYIPDEPKVSEDVLTIETLGDGKSRPTQYIELSSENLVEAPADSENDKPHVQQKNEYVTMNLVYENQHC